MAARSLSKNAAAGPKQTVRDDVLDAADALLAVNSAADQVTALRDSYARAERASERSYSEALAVHERLKAAGADPADLQAFYDASVAHGGASMCSRLTQGCWHEAAEMAFDAIAGEVVGHA